MPAWRRFETRHIMMNGTTRNPLAKAWLIFGGLLAVGFAVMMVREIPSMRRELRLMRM